MFKREGMGAAGGGETVIAQGVKVQGDFTSSGNVVIQGEVTGSVSTKGDLQVGDSAKIHANVEARNADVSGEIRGNISIEEKLDLNSTSRVDGDVTVKTLVVAAGAVINGKVSMEGTEERKNVETEEQELEEE